MCYLLTTFFLHICNLRDKVMLVKRWSWLDFVSNEYYLSLLKLLFSWEDAQLNWGTKIFFYFSVYCVICSDGQWVFFFQLEVMDNGNNNISMFSEQKITLISGNGNEGLNSIATTPLSFSLMVGTNWPKQTSFISVQREGLDAWSKDLVTRYHFMIHLSLINQLAS